MKKPTILITSPSIDTSKNVGGISSLTRLLILHNNYIRYSLTVVGRKDSQKRNVRWIFNQFILIHNFIKKLLFEKEIKIAHINIPLSKIAIYINFVLVIISKIFNKKIVVHLRGGSLSLNLNVNKLQKAIIGICVKLADKVIVLGKKECFFIFDFYNITKKVVILPNSVEIPNFIHKNILRDDKEDPPLKIIFIGRIDKDKGLNEILHALKTIKNEVDYQFYLAGTGPDQQYFISKFIHYLGKKFSYLGVLNNLEKISFFQNADIFILPSYFEGLPNALLESMAYGVVPIVTPVGSIPEVVVNNKNGFIVPLNDYNLISSIISLLEKDRVLLKKIGKASHQTIYNSYSINQYIDKLNETYNSLAKVSLN